MKRSTKKIEPKRFPLWPFLIIAAGITAAIFLPTLIKRIPVTREKPAAKPAIAMWTGDPAERYILDKSVDTPLSPGISPVIIYEVSNGMQYFGASGICYSNATSGTYRLVTVAHAFFKRDQPTSFVIRKLAPCESRPSWCIERIVKIGKQWGPNLDLAECDLKPFGFPLPIVPCEAKVDPNTPMFTKVYTFEDARVAGLTNVSRRVVTSLVSGERVTLCGIVPEADGSSWYYLADYKLIQGESGTAFKDAEGLFYFAEGGSELQATSDIVKQFKLTTDSPGVIFGPIALRLK